jgi:hypothetical protein
MWFESLAKLPEMPELIYTWDLMRVRRESAPRIRDACGAVKRFHFGQEPFPVFGEAARLAS